MQLMTDALTGLVRRHVEPALGADTSRMVLELMSDTATRTISWDGDEAVVITGDIPAMWLRDSCAQLAPFTRLAGHLAAEDRRPVLVTCAAVLRHHWRMIALDPYANAFTTGPDVAPWDPDDQPAHGPWVWERKFELDSLAYPVLLLERVLALGADDALTPAAAAALRTMVEVYETEQHHEAASDYWFHRPGAPAQDTLARGGHGAPCRPTGMVWAGFRPSDDACELPYNIPGNLFAAAALRAASRILGERGAHPAVAGLGAADLAARADRLAADIVAAVRRHGIVPGPLGEPVLAYEVDGLGNHLVMDDANNPSLLGLPYLGALPDGWQELMAATRRVVLSPHNPWWFSGSVLSGVGSPHTGPGRVWPIALATQGLTSDDPAEMRRLLRLLMDTTAGTGRLHEGIDCDDAARFTREWFSWADMMFCELALVASGL